MKKFFTSIPLQKPGKLGRYHYQAQGNRRLEMEEKTSFPIMTAINGYVQPGEEFRVIALMAATEDGRYNRDLLQEELQLLCERRGILCPRGVETVEIPTDERVDTHISTFQKLIDYVQDEDELFACMTFGTKPLSTAMLMAVQYAYRLKENTSLCCIVYGQVDRSASQNNAEWSAHVYDMTALVQLDEIVRMLAERGVANPEQALRTILSL